MKRKTHVHFSVLIIGARPDYDKRLHACCGDRKGRAMTGREGGNAHHGALLIPDRAGGLRGHQREGKHGDPQRSRAIVAGCGRVQRQPQIHQA